jgi:hypothetical protein
MIKYITLLIIILFLVSCKGKSKNSNVEITDFKNLSPGPVVHESLTEEQLNKIKHIQSIFYEVYPISLEESITNFKRDKNPDNEINIWLNMSKAYVFFASNNIGKEKIGLRKEAFKLILMRSMMAEKEAINSSELKLLSKNQIEGILTNYTLKAKPITAEKK